MARPGRVLQPDHDSQQSRKVVLDERLDEQRVEH